MRVSSSLSGRAIGPLALTLSFLAAPAARPDPVSVSISGVSQVTYVPGAYHSFNQSGGNTTVSDSFSFSGGGCGTNCPSNATWTIGLMFEASPGELHASASTACVGTFCYSGDAGGSASFTDLLTINPVSTDLVGRTTDFHFILGISGSLTATGGSYFDAENNQTYGNANSSWQVDASISGVPVLHRSGTDSSFDGFHGDPIARQIVDAVVPLGNPFTLTITLGVGSSLSYDVGAAAADLGHTLTWGGISEVTLADTGTPIDFTVASASGFDYQSSHIPAGDATVPEPSGLALLGAGLLGFSLVASRQKHSASPYRAPLHRG